MLTYPAYCNKPVAYRLAKLHRICYICAPKNAVRNTVICALSYILNIKNVNQQALQMDAFALNIINGTKSIVPGEMGLRDLYLIEKIYESASNNSELLELNNIPNVLDLRKTNG